jgi:hypothetical protein
MEVLDPQMGSLGWGVPTLYERFQYSDVIQPILGEQLLVLLLGVFCLDIAQVAFR